MAYNYCLEELLAWLHQHAPAKADAIALSKRQVEHGLLSVGLKIHCLDNGKQFNALVKALGGARNILEINYYKRSDAFLCLVLPPVGNARSAVMLLEAIEQATRSKLFNNPSIQIQVCSPGRLGNLHSGLISIGFYLGSEVLRQFTLGDFTTTFSESEHHPRGKIIPIYDAGGMFDREFDWWGAPETMGWSPPEIVGRLWKKTPVLYQSLPISQGRTDLLTATSRLDITNTNLLSTLFVHQQYGGYWKSLRAQLEEEMVSMLEEHDLFHLLMAPWTEQSRDDNMFIDAMRELMAFAKDEEKRLRKLGSRFWRLPEKERGILWQMRNMLETYRRKIEDTSRKLRPRGAMT